MATDRLRDAAAGSLVGQALGDALGFVVEGRPQAVCQTYVARELRAPAAGRRCRGGMRFGQYSDDTQLSRELLISYVERGRYDRADVARRFAAMFSEGRIVGRGRATMNAALRLAAGVDLDEAGEPPPAAGNGSAMRAGACALLAPGDPEACAALAASQGELTHRDPRATDGARIIAEATRLALEGPCRPAELERWLESLSRVCRSCPALKSGIAELPRWMAMDEDAAARQVATWGQGELGVGRWDLISPYVVPSVLWSLVSALRHPADPMSAYACAIGCGGDVDTTAAMTGAIVGAAVGFADLPELSAAVHDRGEWDREALRELAERAVTASRPRP